MDYQERVRLITEIEKHQCLYDASCIDYYNRTKKDDAWMSVCKGILEDRWDTMSKERRAEAGKDAERKWNSIKDVYSQALKKVHSSSSSRCKKPPKYHKLMEFLSKPRGHPGTSFEEATISGPVKYDFTNPQLNITEPKTEPKRDAAEMSQETPETYWAKRRKTEHTVETEPLKSTDNPPEPQNPEKMFFLSLLPRFRELSERNKLDFQIKVLQLLQTYT